MKAQRALNSRRRTLARELAWGLLEEGGGDSVESASLQAETCDASAEANTTQTTSAVVLAIEDDESASHEPTFLESASAEPDSAAVSCDMDDDEDWHFEPPPGASPGCSSHHV